MDSDGETRYYVDGVATYAGLVYWDGYFYYFNSSMKAVRSRTYWPTNTNGLIPTAEYTFDENGRITNPPVVGIDAQGQPKNGIYADADGEIRYYVDGVATYAKLVYCNGHYYYIGSSLKAVRDTTHWVSATNGLMEAGSYTFDAQGRMIDPPEDALTEAISTFALTGETMSKTYEYVYASGKLMRQVLTVTIGNSTTTYAMDFFYDASGYPFAVKYNGDLCYYITNLQGDVMSIVDPQGEVVAEYEYDPYGNIVSQSGPLAEVNPLRYRGYVFDSETQFYYLQSRYYDPEIARFINSDSYASTGQGILGNNMFAYCSNNPINFSDPTGEFIFTALVVCVVSGAVIGGAMGGTAAYKSAKSSGLEGADLFWATAKGVGKGSLVGGAVGTLFGITGSVVAAYGATSVAGTATITATATISARAAEVTVLQTKKSINDGDNGWQIANDCLDSVVSNGGKIILPGFTKASTTTAAYVATDLLNHKVVPLGVGDYLMSTSGKMLPYGFVASAWGQTVYSIFCADPIARANERGYDLR